jgi:hypothetical protein
MADVGLGQDITATLRYRSKVLKDAVRDAHPFLEMLDKTGGIKRISGGRTIVDEGKTGQNPTVGWVGASGTVPLADGRVIDSSEQTWRYLMGAITFTRAEQLQNEGEGRSIDLIAGKVEVLEDTMKNKFHEGLLSAGTAQGGLELSGLAAAIPTVSNTGTYAGIDRSNADAAWFRNQTFNTATSWGDGTVDAGNVKRFLDKGINSTMRNSMTQVSAGFLGQTHFEYLTQAIQAIQVIQNENETGKAGFQKLVYRGIPMFFGGGVNYSGYSAMTATRTYLLCTKPGGVNLVYHKKAEFDMLEEIQSNDQAALSRLMFTMANMTVGPLAKLNWVGFD